MRQVLRVDWYRFRATFSRRWSGYLAIVLLLGSIGGLAMGAVAGARRTQSSYRAFLESTNPSDITLIVSRYGPQPLDDARVVRSIARLPHVKRLERVVTPNAFLLGTKGEGVDLPAGLTLAVSNNGLFFDQDRATAVEGRMANPRRADEMIMTVDAARALHAHVGSVLPFGFWTLPPTGRLTGTAAPPGRPSFRAKVMVVGIVLLNGHVVQDDVDSHPSLAVFSPALMPLVERRCRTSCASVGSLGLQVDETRNVAAVQHDVERVLPKQWYPAFELRSILEAKAQRAIRPAATALGVFGAIVALAALLIVGQVVGRLLLFGADDLDQLRALGAGPLTTSTDGLIGVVAALLVGAVAATAVAVGLSPLAPLGSVRRVYPSRGIAFDWTVLGFWIVLFVVVLSAFAATVAFRQAPHRSARRNRFSARRGSRLARAAATSGVPAPAVAGIRLALEPGRGRSAVPVRSSLIGTTLAVVIVVATLVFGSSLSTLVSRPALYGWNWTYALQAANNGPVPPATQAALDQDPDVAEWSGMILQQLIHVDGLLVPALTQVPNASPAPPVLSGHAIDGRDQMVLGTATLARLHKHVGDTVVSSLGLPKDAPFWVAPARFRIVGTATFPTIGFVAEQNTSMSTGVLFSNTPEPRNAGMLGLRAGFGPLNGPTMVLVQLRHDVDPARARMRLERIVDQANTNKTAAALGWTISLLPVQRPAEIVNYRSMGYTPALLAIALAVGATVALALTLTASVRRRRRDLALLKTIGFTRRQLVGTVATQASVAAIIGTVFGVPIGIVTGRWLWNQFARSISAVPQPTVPALSIAIVSVGAFVLANLVAAIPGLLAARTPGALVLRAE